MIFWNSISWCFKLFGCWQNLVELRDEEGLLLKERRRLKNVCSISLLVLKPGFVLLHICFVRHLFGVNFNIYCVLHSWSEIGNLTCDCRERESHKWKIEENEGEPIVLSNSFSFLVFFFPLKSLPLFQKFRSWLCSNLKYIAIPKLTRTLFFCMCFCTWLA